MRPDSLYSARSSSWVGSLLVYSRRSCQQFSCRCRDILGGQAVGLLKILLAAGAAEELRSQADAPEWDGQSRLSQRLGDRAAQSADDAVLLNGQQGARLP